MPASVRAFLVQDFSGGEISYKVKKSQRKSTGSLSLSSIHLKMQQIHMDEGLTGYLQRCQPHHSLKAAPLPGRFQLTAQGLFISLV